MSQSLSIKKHHCFEEYRLSRNLVLVRRIYTLLGKVAGAWIWPQTTIKSGENEWGYNSMLRHECAGHLNGRQFGAFVRWGFKRIWCVRRIKVSNNISESMFGKFPSQRPVFIPHMCTVPCDQSIKCQVHCLETSHMWHLCSVECQLADRLRSCRLWMWETVHGGLHYNIWHPPAELFHTIKQKTATWIFIVGKLRF